MNPDALQKLKEKLTAIDEAVTLNELKKAVEAMLQFSVKLQDKTEKELTTIAESVQIAISRIETMSQAQTDDAKQELQDSCDSMMSDMKFQCEAMISEAQAKVDSVENGQNGVDADEEKVIQEVLARIPKEEPIEETPESVRDMLETLEGEERLDASAIKGIEEMIVAKTPEQSRIITGMKGIEVFDEGINLGLVHLLNFTGAGVTVSRVGDSAIIAITGGGGGGSVIATPTGTVDGANKTFTAATKPQYIIVDGLSKFETVHWTYAGTTITINATEVAPVEYIRTVT
jgi:hypothetical protein